MSLFQKDFFDVKKEELDSFIGIMKGRMNKIVESAQGS